jgi:long-chain fatty acid transport protein
MTTLGDSKMKSTFKLQLIPALITVAFSGTAMAAGFQLQNQNGAGTGLAFAGQAANAEDASTIYFNPAGMSMLRDGQNASIAGSIINRSVNFTDTGTTANVGAPLLPLGGNGGNAGGTSLIPAGYYSYTVNPKVRVGLGISVPYGSKTEYSTDYVGRYSASYTEIQVLNINPSVSYKVNDDLSVGFGINIAKADLELRQMAVVAANVERPAYLTGSDTAYGWNAGLLYKVSPQTMLGVSYRSTLSFNLSGNQTVVGAINRDITADLETPDSLSIAINHKLSDRTDILADVTWTGWSSVNALRAIVASTGAAAAAPLRFNYDDTIRFGLGVKHQYNADWNIRAGFAIDKTPVPNDQSRTMTVPDSDRTWLSVGARYKMSEKASLDMGFAHVMLKNSAINRAVTNTAETATLQTVNGSFKTKVNILSLQYNINF